MDKPKIDILDYLSKCYSDKSISAPKIMGKLIKHGKDIIHILDNETYANVSLYTN